MLLLVCGLLCLAGFIRERRFPVWSFPALGVMLALVSMGAGVSLPILLVWIGIAGVTIYAGLRRKLPFLSWEAWLLSLLLLGAVLAPLTIDPNLRAPTPYQQSMSFIITLVTWLTLLSALPAAIGRLLARHANVLAGLVFVGSAYVIWDGIGDPAYALMLWTNNLIVVKVVSILPQVFFLIVVPILVLSAQSFKARVLSFLLPILIGFVSAAAIGSALRPYNSFFYSVVFDTLCILLPLAICLIVYAKSNAARSMSPLSVERI